MGIQHDVNEIRRRMAAVRDELDEEVDDLPASVKALTSWRNVVRAYPWECVATATLFGYYLVPQRRFVRPDAEFLTQLASSDRSVQTGVGSRGGWVATGTSMLGKLVVRGVAGYVGREIARLLADRMETKGEPP